MELDPLANDLSTSLLEAARELGMILALTGWRGAGKTSICKKIIGKHRSSGLKIAGLLSPGRYVQGERDGIYARDLAGGETRLLASIVPGEIDGVQLGPWFFDSQTMDWGNRLLEKSAGADLLVIDEIGFMEFWLKSGWTASFDVLKRKEYRLALVVIRPECLESFSSLGFSFLTEEVIDGAIKEK